MTAPPRSATPGARPTGITEEQAAARYVRDLFSRIADRYDLLNHLLSFQMDRCWRHALARQFRHRLTHPQARVLDLCCGTADLMLALARQALLSQGALRPKAFWRRGVGGQGRAAVVGCDFSHPMLTRAAQKLRQRSLPPLVAEADALQLPFPDGAFDLVVCSFGFRNLANYGAGLAEIWRVLKPGGEVGILEFSEPRGWLRPFYSFYFHRILPRIGEWVSGVRGSYSYLPSSVDRFPEKEDIADWMRETAFVQVSAVELTGGIVTLYTGRKAPS